MAPDATRRDWITVAERVGRPVLTHLAARTLRAEMPVECRPGSKRETVAHLEAIGRLLTGLAPWLELDEPASRPWAELAREGLDAITDPRSPDFGNFAGESQALVDTAFLAQSILRAPTALWDRLAARVRANVTQALRITRRFAPAENNWLLFSATVEAALRRMGSDWDRMRVDYAVRQHEQWYKGDGIYGDGPQYHADYYNAFVIHPMLVDLVRALPDSVETAAAIWKRAVRHAEIQERLISPEGTFPPMGRSLAYRFGALQGLAQMALLHRLPSSVAPAQARCALTAVIRRMIAAPGTFDPDGWLRIGFCGAQPEIGEAYISTGSLYLCSAGLLPLGLPVTDPFWSNPDEPWTACRAWTGAPFPIDKALSV